MFNVESEANCTPSPTWPPSMDHVAPVALRVNPDLPPKTHDKTDTSVKGVKFGLDIDTILDVRPEAWPATAMCASSGCTCTSARRSSAPEPYRQGVEKGVALIDKLRAQGHRSNI